jgi:succinyl-CoA synthetase beta subunit
MIRLLEHEGKRLLAGHGFAVPDGALHPDAPEGAGPWVVKAQVPVGGRGKAGGIQMADTAPAAAAMAGKMIGLSIGGHRVEQVYVERRLDAARELYLAAYVDRDMGRVVLLACAEGGVDIESVPAERVVKCPVDPLIGLRDYTVARIATLLGGDGTDEAALRKAITGVYETLVAEDAELVEINPLIVERSGAIVAGDAKVVLDEDAAFRHQWNRSIPDGTPFEEDSRRLEVIGVELDGDIAAMMNGAGMTMATLDQVMAMGGSIRALVELHGVMWRGPEHIAKVIDRMLSLKPKVMFFNVYFQFRTLDTIADGIVLAVEKWGQGAMPPVVVRMRGNKEAEARRILEGVNCFVTGDFKEACAKAIELSGRPVRPV